MKRTSIIAIILLITMVFTACSSSKKTKAADQITPSTTIDIYNLPVPEEGGSTWDEYPEIEWPTGGAWAYVPPIDWSNYGAVYVDTDDRLWVEIGYSTLINFEAFVSACQDAGFVEESYYDTGYLYFGVTADGQAIQVCYQKWTHYISFIFDTDATCFSRFWEAEG